MDYEYTKKDIFRLAKRINNSKRNYLLVNPLQAKHIPISPGESLRMMKTFGRMLCEKYPEKVMVIGFAETATAIGAVVAECFSDTCFYIHTTREDVLSVDEWVTFDEEHSHAVHQKINFDFIRRHIAEIDTIIFVDDEISTGKTLTNIINQLCEKCGELKEKRIVAASLLNRVSEENLVLLNENGIVCEYLVRLPNENYSIELENISVDEAKQIETTRVSLIKDTIEYPNLTDIRKGLSIGEYTLCCNETINLFISCFSERIKNNATVAVLGTEECMYPALKLGEALESMDRGYTVKCHSTTRSPIGISTKENYPIYSGYKLQSFYSDSRDTYIYDAEKYDVMIVISDTPEESLEPIYELCSIMINSNKGQVFYLQGGNVWYTVKS